MAKLSYNPARVYLLRKPRVPARGYFFRGYGTQRVICLVDGFNLYHSIKRLASPQHKWVNLNSLASVFIRPNSQILVGVYYFSAYATWLPESMARHVQFVKANSFYGVKPIMGQFKKKEKLCRDCKKKRISYEEKETDVNIALTLLDLAYKNFYDHAFVISNDSDLAPAIRLVLANFPEKRVTTIAPPCFVHSNELIRVSSAKAKIQVKHLERCRMTELIYDSEGHLVASCPDNYCLEKLTV